MNLKDLERFELWDLEEVFTEEDEKFLTCEDENEKSNELARR